jgi:hypothetical protein
VPTQPTPGNGTAESGSVVRLLLKGSTLVGVVAAITMALFLAIPEDSDNFEAINLKHTRLTTLPSPRIVLIGGSNLAFGINSEILRSRTGCEVVNMGFNGYLGIRFMLAEARPHIRPGDIVVVAFEYDNYVKSVDGTSADLLMAGVNGFRP